MNRALTILKGLALATIPVVGAFLCVFLLQLSEAVRAQSSSLNSVLSQANTALATINRPKSGTLWMLNETILQGRLTIDATNKVLIHEQNQLGTLDKDIADLSGHTSATLAALTGAATAAQGTLEASTSTIQAAQPLLGSANALVAHLDAETAPLIDKSTMFVANANALTLQFQPLVRHVDQGVVTGDHMLFTADQIETKASQCYLHPTFGCMAKGLIMPAAQIGGGVAQMMK